MSKTLPLVTIGIPTYNRANATLPDALRSALCQDYPNIEIVISNNCSKDNTDDVVKSFNDERIRYIRQSTNIGPTNNYNACLSAAKGDYFILLHDDDLIDPDFISTCLKAADHSTAYSFIRTGARIIDSEGIVTHEEPNSVNSNNPDDLFLAWVKWQTSFYLCSTLFNTRALKKIGGFSSPNNLFEDGFAIIKLSAEAPLINIPDLKASFRKHDEQRTFAQNPTFWYEDFRKALDLIYSQNPQTRSEIYDIGMHAFTKTSFTFAFKVKNPFKKALAVLYVGKYFPYYYWPDFSWSWKMTFMKFAARLFFHGKNPVRHQKPNKPS